VRKSGKAGTIRFESLGRKRGRAEQQRQMITQLSVKDSNDLNQPRLPENMRWRIGSLQFCTIHVVGSNNAMFATPAMREAWALRQQANAIWLTETAVLAKRYGWGFHHDGQGRVALVPLGSTRYQELSDDVSLTQLRAMRSRRASVKAGEVP